MWRRFRRKCGDHTWLHRRLLILWICPGIPVSILLRESIAWLIFISVYTIITSHWAAEEAADEHTRFHKIAKWLWVFPGLPISWLLRDSVPWLMFMSVYAVIVSHAAAEEAADQPT